MTRTLVNVDDYRTAARRLLPRMLFEFVDGTALDGQTGTRNRSGFSDWWFRARSFHSTDKPDTSWSAFGRRHNVPIIIAPTGASGLLWPNGEARAAQAAASRGHVMEVSAGSLLTMEDIAAGGQGRGERWLQIFLYRDRELTREFLSRAKAAGYEAICVTTDAPVHGRRENDTRNGFTIDQRLTLGTLFDAALHYRWWLRMRGSAPFRLNNFANRATGNMNDMAAYIASVLDPNVSWDDVDWLRSEWDGPIIIKGILHPDDARNAIECGCDGLQVSNHGGRQLDGTLSAIDALPCVVDATAGRVPVFLDGGVRRGTDILKAVALGATACVIGRAHLWGLAVAGDKGVEAICDVLAAELRNAMIIGGWKSLADLDSDAVMRLGQ
ncbi:alpha-hydroxy acid oxidase [Pelagibacterium mangrovi]|uniref:alpha-hydroxy acid oxidase n=1 Tax=Pelagibacterium mangrovi TaxID=3119828 RepID=UPI002FC9F224